MDIREYEALPHAERVRKLVALGKASREDTALAGQLEALGRGEAGFFAQTLALYACNGSGNTALCRQILLSSPSKTLRELARTVLLHICPDSQVPEVLLQLCGLASKPEHSGKLLHILHQLHKSGRHAATAHVVHGVALWVDPQAKVAPTNADSEGVPIITAISLEHKDAPRRQLLGRVLAFGNEQQVRLMLGPLLKVCEPATLPQVLPLLAQRHPRLVVEAMTALPSTEAERAQRLSACAPQLVLHAPALLLDLLRSLPKEERQSYVQSYAPSLLSKLPEQVLQELTRLQAEEGTSQPLSVYLTKAQAARKQHQVQRAAARAAGAAAGAAGAPAAAASSPAAAGVSGAAAAGGIEPGPASADMSMEEEPEGSWTALSTASSVVSMDDGVSAVKPEGSKPGAAASGDKGSLASQPDLYALARRKRQYPDELHFCADQCITRRVRGLRSLPAPALLQLLLNDLATPSKYLENLPAARRVELYQAWKAWWADQKAKLLEVKRSIAPEAVTTSQGYQQMELALKVRAMRPWTLPTIADVEIKLALRRLPTACVADFADVLIKDKFPMDTAVEPVLCHAQLLPDALLKLLQEHPHLWNKGTKTQSLTRLSGAQQAQLLRSDPAAATAEALEQALTQMPGDVRYGGVAATLEPLVAADWEKGCKLLLASVAAPDAAPADIPAGYRMLEVVPGPVKRELLVTLLDHRNASQVQAIKLLRCTRVCESNPLVLHQALLAGLQIHPKALEDVFQRWEEHLAGPAGGEGLSLEQVAACCTAGKGASAPRQELWQAMKATLQVLEDKATYTRWLMPVKDAADSPYKEEYHNLPATAPLACALPPASRLALVLRAARDAAALHPTPPSPTTPQGLSEPFRESFLSHIGAKAPPRPRQGALALLQLLVTEPGHMLRGWTREHVKQLLAAVPGLWIKAPHLLTKLPAADVVSLLQQWQQARAAVEAAMAHLLAAAHPAASNPLPASTPNEGTSQVATGAPGGAGAQAAALAAGGGATIGAAGLAEVLSEKGSELLKPTGDPVLAAVTELGRQLVGADPQGNSGVVAGQLYQLYRHVLLEEWAHLPRDLLPPAIQAMVARAVIMRATEKHSGPIANLFNTVKSELPYLKWREITEAPCFKERLTARDAGERAAAMEYLVECLVHHPDLLGPLLQAIHTRRREQDDTRQLVLRKLLDQLPAFVAPLKRRQVQQAALQQAEQLAQAWLAAEENEQQVALGVDTKAVVAAALVSYQESVAEAAAENADPDDERYVTNLQAQLPALAAIIQDALAARDLSQASIGLLRRLAHLVLPVDPLWAATQLAAVSAHCGLSTLASPEPVSALVDSVTDHLEELATQTKSIHQHMERALRDACAGLPAKRCASTKPQELAEQLQGTKPRARGRQKHRQERANAARVLREQARRPPPKMKHPHDSLQEHFLQQVLSQVLPPQLQALVGRQDGLICSLRLLKAVGALLHKLLNAQLRAPEVNTTLTLQPAFTQLLLSRSLLGAVCALPHAAGLPGATSQAESIEYVAWFADQVMLREPNQYSQLLPLMLPKKEAVPNLAAGLVPHLTNCLNDSWPAGRFDLLLPFMLESSLFKTVSTKAVQLMFQYHGDQVAATVPRLLASDPTFIMLPKVFWYVTQHQQTLLPPLAPSTTTNTTTMAATTTVGSAAAGVFREGAPTSALICGMGQAPQKAQRGVAGGGRGGGRGPAAKRGRLARVATQGKRPNYGGWSRSDLHTSLRLGTPCMGFSTTCRLAPSQQRALGQELVAALKTQGTLDVRVVRRLVRRLAALPALPASFLLDLLEAAGGAPAAASGGSNAADAPAGQPAGTAAGAGAGPHAAALQGEAVQDVVLSALVQLDNMSQAWDALLEALSKGASSTALSAVSALLAAEIKALSTPSRDTPAGAAGAGGDVEMEDGQGGAGAGGDADMTDAQEGPTEQPASSGAAALLAKMRSLPWQRPAVMREVIKLLGQLAVKSCSALHELHVICEYARLGLTPVKATATTTPSATTSGTLTPGVPAIPTAATQPPAAAEGTSAAAGAAGVDVGGLPLPQGRELHRSAHLQLLATLQEFYGEPFAQAAFQAAATADNKEIASAAAFVPGKVLQRAQPASVVPACAALFLTLLDHPEQEVRVHAMRQWSDAEYAVPLEEAMLVVNRIMALSKTKKDDATAETKKRRAVESDAANQCLRKYFASVVAQQQQQAEEDGGVGDGGS